ncbi:mitogen-activated protein kinase kinase kinase 18-like [Durio zibethinus]|uniref:Mitogen-activated protein kinase kinase kinase 18-like n=1 Tax=Durio zibethinus TaxID=66656 RepID=A0A6P5XSK9_DURZI|nr:mitogen-activated protein kinase kinase kinase 18-like [Durio zibethinus]
MEKQSYTQKLSWTRGKCLGKGSFGTVSLAIKESDGDVFAVKSVDLATCLPKQLESLENEIRILRSLSSPYVVEYLGDDVTRYESPTTSNRNLHMEYLPGGTTTDEEIMKRRLADMDDRILRWHTRCLVSALEYVHGEGIVHCDVKGKNVLVGPDFTSVKLADFGSAIEIKKVGAGDRCRSLITPRGTPLWMAPEVIRGEYQGPESDVWSLGCTVIEMVTGKPGWEDQGFNSLCRIANSGELPELPTQLSELGKDFVEKCLRRDRSQRWSCDQLLQHPFVASASAPNMTGESSPRCVLDFANSDFEEDENTENCEASAIERIGKLATEGGVIWESDGWLAVRSYARESGVNCDEGTSAEYVQLMRTEQETEGTSSVYWSSMGIRQGIEMTISEFYDYFDSSNSIEWQCSNYKGVRGLKSLSGGLRCECSGSSCRYGSQKVELAVAKGELRFYIFCNLLQLFLFDLRIFTSILMVFFSYSFVTIFFTFGSQPNLMVMRFDHFIFKFKPEEKVILDFPSHHKKYSAS